MENAENDPATAKACASELATMCRGIDGKGAIHRCLFDNFGALSKDCRDTEFATQVMKSESLVLNPYMASVCKSTAAKYCHHTQDVYGTLRLTTMDASPVITCLINHKDRADVPKACTKRLNEEVIKRSKHLQFNPEAKTSCI